MRDDILPNMTKNILLLGLVSLSLAGGLAVPAAAGDRIALYQSNETQLQHQRMVGNVRAQARREGVVVNVPQLYVFLSDQSAAFHMDGYRTGFERELNLIVDRSRRARSMVRLDRLLERVRTADGSTFNPDDLPPADVYIALYRRADCATCDQVAEALAAWHEGRPGLAVVWLDVSLDRPPR